jgi:phosphoglycolate phosphatase
LAAAEVVAPFVLFDLDGTVTDSAPSILGALRRTFADFDLPMLDADTERSLLGPPFRETLPALIGGYDIEQFITVYRSYYATDGVMYETVAYDGIEVVLHDLVACGTQLGLATSKAEMMAEPILRHLGLNRYFTHITGDRPDGSRGAKALVVAEALRRFGHPAPEQVVMVGDRAQDVQGAGAHGVATLGAGWGYGAPGELAEAGAVEVFARPVDLGVHFGLTG